MGLQRTFGYRARDAAGQLVTGTLVAASPDEVGSRLRSEGKYVLSVDEHALTSTTAPQLDVEAIRSSEAAKRIRRDDVIAFAQQLGVMLETGVPLGEALDAFRRQSRSPEFRQVLEGVTNAVQAGEPLSVALSRWPRVFPGIMVSLLKAAEASGTMATMLSRIGHYLAKERRTARQIKGALSYPLFMLIIGLGISVFLVAVVLPRFATIYKQRSASLPLPTKILMGISDALIHHMALYGPVVAVLAVALVIWLRRPSGRKAIDWVRLNLPILRTLYGQLYLTRAARTMSTLLAAGVSLLDIIDICRGVTANHYWSRLWDKVDRQVRNGQQVSEAIADSGLIPGNVVSMIAAGERAGRLDEVMERIATFSEDELDTAVKQTTTFIEPLMICIMGVVVGGVAIALLLPIFTVGRVMSGQG